MNKLVAFLDLVSVRLATAALLSVLWAFFAYRHFLAFQTTGEWSYIFIAISESATAVFLAFRSAPETVSVDPIDWLFAVSGTFLPLLFVPAEWGAVPVAKHFIVLGIFMQFLGLVSLNRSLAFVAAKRELKLGGMYRFMRHPLYASYFVMFTGYVLANTTLMNLAIYFLTLGLLSARMLREEKHLAQDPAYCAYMQAVPFRILPFVV